MGCRRQRKDAEAEADAEAKAEVEAEAVAKAEEPAQFISPDGERLACISGKLTKHLGKETLQNYTARDTPSHAFS